MWRLNRDPDGGVVVGVCSGLAKAIRLEPSLVRLAFALLALAGGAGIVLYVILAVLLPVAGTEATRPADRVRENLILLPRAIRGNQRGVGLVLLVAGLLVVANQHGLLAWITWERTWPVLLSLGGAALLFAKVPGDGRPK